MLDMKTILCIFAAIGIAQAQTDVFISPSPVTVIEGEEAVVTCSPRPTNGIPILSIAPPGAGDNFAPVEDEDVRTEDDGTTSRTFFVSGLTRNNNASRFRCSIASTPSDPALLLVYYVPSISISSNTSVVVEGGSFSFTFSAEAYPEPTQSVTRLEGGPTPSIDITEGDVTLSNILREHAGVYVFSSTNEAGATDVTFEVTVHYSPSITITSEDNKVIVTVDDDVIDDVTFTFSVDANPEPTANPTVARMDGGALLPLIEVTESTVTFRNIMEEHLTTYVLTSTNEIGSGEVEVTICGAAFISSLSILSTLLMTMVVMLLQ